LISPLVYGTNYGPWQNLTGSMITYMEEVGFTFLHFRAAIRGYR